MIEDFVDRVVSLLNNQSHRFLITVVQLVICELVLVMDSSDKDEYGNNQYGNDTPTNNDPNYESPCRTAFLRLVPSLVKILINFLSVGP